MYRYIKQTKAFVKALTIIILFLMAEVPTFAQQGNPSFDASQKKAVINKALELIKENYVFPGKYDQIEKEIKNKLLNKEFDNLNNPQDFLNQLNKDLQIAGQDRHLKISFSPQIVKQIIEDKKKGDNSPTQYTPELLSWMKFENYGLRKVERMEGNIGYFKFDRFTDLQLAKEAITGAMNFINNSSAIILDLRDNGGGDSGASELIVNYFFPDGKKLGDFKFRKDAVPKENIVKHDPSVKKIPDNIPVYILVSNKTASAAEYVSYVLQQFKRATVIGEQTSGKANPGELFVVNDFLYMMVPTGAGRILPTWTNWEGTGVIPDIKIDPFFALSKVITEICPVLEKQDQNSEHKTLYKWINDQYSAQLNPEPLSQKLVNSIVGTYEGNRRITLENGMLYYVGGNGAKRSLTYMNNSTFMTEGRTDYRLKFPPDQKIVDHYDVLWFDGTSDKVKRAN